MKNESAGVATVPLEECKRRAAEFGAANTSARERRVLPASEFADAIWPGHRMKPQGAGAAATRILKRLEAEGRAGWWPSYNRSESRTRWGWWAVLERFTPPIEPEPDEPGPDDVGFCPYDREDDMCWYCTGEACAICDIEGYPPFPPGCEHDAIDRHPRDRHSRPPRATLPAAATCTAGPGTRRP